MTSFVQIVMMIVLGYVLRKKEIISDCGVSELSKMLLSVVLPFSVLSSGNETGTSDLAFSLLSCALVVAIYYLVSLAISYVTFKTIHKDNSRLGVSVTMAVFANTGFIGIPLAKILYGASGLMVAVVYNLLYNLFLFTVGIRLFGSKENRPSWKEIVIDPLSISSVLAILLFLSPYKIPPVINDVLVQVGDMTVPISMMIVGAWMVNVDWTRIFSSIDSYLVCFFRLILFPIIGLLILKPLISDEGFFGSVVLLTALPIGSLNIIFAEKYKADVNFANETMLLSMALSLFTIPIVMTMV